MKYELEGKILTKIAELIPKIYTYSIDDGNSDEKLQEQKKYVIGRILTFEDYNNCLQIEKIILRPEKKFKNEANNVFLEELNKIALGSSNDKKLQTFNKITSQPYGVNAVKVCKTELLGYLNIK